MQLDRLIAYFATSPAIRLIRSHHAPLVVAFLNAQFKETGQITWGHSELVARLKGYQEGLREDGIEGLNERAESYLAQWCRGETRWLSRYFEATLNEPVYELSPNTELVLRFIRDAVDRRFGFVGTESRLKRIVDALSGITTQGSDDPNRRLEFLRGERSRIDAEINAIETQGFVTRLTPTAIRERFADAVEDLLNLQSDFRAVEESFRHLTRVVQQRHAESTGSRGQILEYALDAEDQLKSEDQGISFQEFVRFILSPAKQEELDEIISRLSAIDELSDQSEGLRRVRAMVPALLNEAQKVLKTTQRLSATLRRVLDRRSHASRVRLATVLHDIKKNVIKLSPRHAEDTVCFKIETEIDLYNFSERCFWSPPTQFSTAEFTDNQPDDDDRIAAFKSLAQLRRLDWSSIKKRIRTELAKTAEVSLVDMFRDNPPEGGAVELLGFLQIAHDEHHHVDPTERDSIELPLDSRSGFLEDSESEAYLKRWSVSHRTKPASVENDPNLVYPRMIVLEIPRVVFRRKRNLRA